MIKRLSENVSNLRLLTRSCSLYSSWGGSAAPPTYAWKVAGEDPSSQKQLNGVHAFQCPDKSGIMAKLTECIASHGGNLINGDVFVSSQKQVFYSRSEFVYDPLQWPRVAMDEDFGKLAKMFSAQKSIVRVPEIDAKFKIAVLASRQDHCLVDLLHEWQEGKLPVEITCVISNHNREPNTHVIRFLERHGIPYHYFPISKENKREEEILKLVGNTDFLVLARYMQSTGGTQIQNTARKDPGGEEKALHGRPSVVRKKAREECNLQKQLAPQNVAEDEVLKPLWPLQEEGLKKRELAKEGGPHQPAETLGEP